MFIPQPNRKAIHTYLFNEGVIVVKKNFFQKEHETIPVPNLHVIKALQSLKSRGYVTETFSWQYYYYILNEEGITYLRAQLNLPESVVPATVAKALKAPASERPTRGGDRRGPREDGGYRRRDDGEKKVGASADFKPDFRSGFGRSAPVESQQ